jgi:hypothetical protein
MEVWPKSFINFDFSQFENPRATTKHRRFMCNKIRVKPDSKWCLLDTAICDPTGAECRNNFKNNPITIDPNTGNLVRAGFSFLGWNTEPDGSGTSYSAGETPALPAGTTLYAAWEEIPEPLASTGGTPAPLMPVALFLVTVGAILARTRKYKGKH